MPGFLPASAVQALRRLARDGMLGTCVVRRPATTIGTGGQPTTTWSTVPALSALSCSFVPAGVPSEAVTADAVRAATRFTVKFAPDAFGLLGTVPAVGTPQRATYAGILPTDRLEIAHDVPGVPSPLLLSVLGDQPSGTPYEITRRVLAERVTAGGA